MSGHDRPPHYHAFLLRCWQERSQYNQQLDTWRFSLEDPRTGARRGFSTLSAAVAAVQEALAGAGDSWAAPDQPAHDDKQGDDQSQAT